MGRAYVFVTRDGREHETRPMDGRPYSVKVLDLLRYEQALQDNSFYAGLGGEITDNRKTTG